MSQCAVPELAAMGRIHARNLSTVRDDLCRFFFAGRSSSIVPAVRAARHHQGGDALAFLCLLEKPDKGK